MITRERLIEISIWLTIQDAIRKNEYSNISKSLLRACSREEKKGIDTGTEDYVFLFDLKDIDRDFIENKLSSIAELLDI